MHLILRPPATVAGDLPCRVFGQPACPTSPSLCLPFLTLALQPCLYRSWDDPYHACQDVWPMLWDKACPDTVPPQLQHLVLTAGKGKGATAEL